MTVDLTVALTVQFVKEKPTWGYDRISGALSNVGDSICDTTIGNILKTHGLEPAPDCSRTGSWECRQHAKSDARPKGPCRRISTELSALVAKTGVDIRGALSEYRLVSFLSQGYPDDQFFIASPFRVASVFVDRHLFSGAVECTVLVVTVFTWQRGVRNHVVG